MAEKVKNTWEQLKTRVRDIEWQTVRKVAIALLLVGSIVSAGGSLYNRNTFRDFIEAFYANVGTELISIALTVLVIDWLYERRNTQRFKTQLIREMGSADNGISTRAVRELRAHGWLQDGSLRGAELSHANLQEADLRQADLQHTTLFSVILKRAILFEANLQGASLVGADLKGANLREADLRGADLKGAELGDTDLINANLQEADLRRGAIISVGKGWLDMPEANLKGAVLSGADLRGARIPSDRQLAKAKMLRGAVMPDGSRYDGRFNLQGDIEAAKQLGIDVANPMAMASFYETLLEDRKAHQVALTEAIILKLQGILEETNEHDDEEEDTKRRLNSPVSRLE